MRPICFFLFMIGLAAPLTGQDIFPELEGWQKSGSIQSYKPVNLYEYINGAAELYLNYNFRALQVAEYQHGNSGSLIVEVYRHQTANDAFGIYSQERPTNGQFLNIGAQGYLELPILNFLTNTVYVKISSYDLTENAEQILMSYAEKLAARLGVKTSLPEILQCFPDPGKIPHAEKYVSNSFLGHGFLHSGFMADYVIDKKSFQLFIIEGADSSDCQEMLAQYFQFCHVPLSMLKPDQFILDDPYHGKIPLVWKGKYIWGISNPPNESVSAQYLQKMADSIKKQNQ